MEIAISILKAFDSTLSVASLSLGNNSVSGKGSLLTEAKTAYLRRMVCKFEFLEWAV